MNGMPRRWPLDRVALEAEQRALSVAADRASPWGPRPRELAAAWEPLCLASLRVTAAFAAFPRGEGGPGAAGQPVVAAAALWRHGRVEGESLVRGASYGPYIAGLLALRCGALLEAAVAGLPQPPDLVLVDATGRDHPRRAGLALHLGARLGVPSVGVTNRALIADYEEPDEAGGSFSPLRAGEELVGYAVRTRAGARPVLAHAAWRTTPEVARDVVLALSGRWRTPLPLRAARTLARTARASCNEDISPDGRGTS